MLLNYQVKFKNLQMLILSQYRYHIFESYKINIYSVNVPSKSNKTKKLEIFFCWHLENHGRREQDPDPKIRGTDPRIRIRPKMSLIRNTGHDSTSLDLFNFLCTVVTYALCSLFFFGTFSLFFCLPLPVFLSSIFCSSFFNFFYF